MTIDTPARIAFLKKIHLFHGMDDAELEGIANVLDEAVYAEGEVVFEQGSKAENFYMIYKGNVKIERKHQKKDTQLAVLVKNDYFGEMGLVVRRKRSGTVTATSDATLLVMKSKDFEEVFKRAPQVRLNMEVAIQSRKLARSMQFKWLRPDEVVYFLARKHRVILYEKMLIPALGLIVPLGLLYAWASAVSSSIVLLASVLSLLAIIGWMAWVRIDWGNDYYIVTNQRVVWLEKVVGIYDSRQESPLSTILSVGVETDQLGRILHYGNVIIRTFVGKISFNQVTHPEQAQHMIEEYWNRTKEHAAGIEKEAMKNAIRKRLGLPMPKQERGFGEPALVAKKEAPPPKKPASRFSLGKFFGSNTLKLRYESGDNVVYRKHWIVLLLQAWLPFLSSLVALIFLILRLIQLAYDPEKSLFLFQDGFHPDTWSVVFFFALFPFVIWLGYEVVDWSNDKFEVTNEQIFDIDRKPFGTEIRNAAQLESILGTYYERKGILGNLFNYGTVHITVGGTKMAFEDVVDPATVQSDIDRRRMARSASQNAAKIAAERDRMAEWIATYHKAADQFKEEEKRNQKK